MTKSIAHRVLGDYGPRATKQLTPLLLHLSNSGIKGQLIHKRIGAFVYTLVHHGDAIMISRVHHSTVG